MKTKDTESTKPYTVFLSPTYQRMLEFLVSHFGVDVSKTLRLALRKAFLLSVAPLKLDVTNHDPAVTGKKDKFPGVTWNKRKNHYDVRVRQVWGGVFDDFDEAVARAVDMHFEQRSFLIENPPDLVSLEMPK